MFNNIKIKMSSILEKYKIIFSGFTNHEDINNMCNLLRLSNEEKHIVINYFNTMQLQQMISYNEFDNIIQKVDKLTTQEDVYEYLYKLSYKTFNKIQLNTIIRIASIKPQRTITNKSNVKILKYKKACPHCSHKNIINEYSDYVICGYSDIRNGYDWMGCGRDWCAKCGRKLCKKWDSDNLFLLENRHHNISCCMLHAKQNGLDHQIDYCNCK